MKGIVLLFLAVSTFGILWQYMDKTSKKQAKSIVSQNLMPITLGILAVAIAVFFSTNTNLKLL